MRADSIGTIKRGYVEAGGRQVHYRVGGKGPPAVLLHDSPRSSRLHLPLMQVLGTRFQVFALDTPGYGNSDPIGLPHPTIPDFATALGEAISALGLDAAPVYATHTSAKIALALAVRGGTMPLLVLDGLSIPDPLASDDFISSYMRPFTPEPTGAWLGAEWSRTRDMMRWFPWFTPTPSCRIQMAPPSTDWLEDYGIDLFSTGPHYADAYTAAMRWSPAEDLLAVNIPTVIGARRDDVLYAHLDKIPCDTNHALSIERLDADRTKWAEWIATTLADGAKSDAPKQVASKTAMRGYVSLEHGQLHWQRRPSPAAVAARPLVILSLPSTLEAHDWAERLVEERTTIVPDMPGFGDSDPLTRADADALADALAALIVDLGPGQVDVLAIGLATPIGARLAARHPTLIGALAIWGAPSFDAPPLDALCPDVAFDHVAGSHLHRFWHMLRDGAVQWPWFDNRPQAARPVAAMPNAGGLYRALTGMLKQRIHYGQGIAAALAANEPATWRAVERPMVIATGDDPSMACAASLIDLAPHGAAFDATAETAPVANALAKALAKAGDRENMR